MGPSPLNLNPGRGGYLSAPKKRNNQGLRRTNPKRDGAPLRTWEETDVKNEPKKAGILLLKIRGNHTNQKGGKNSIRGDGGCPQQAEGRRLRFLFSLTCHLSTCVLAAIEPRNIEDSGSPES